MLRNSTERSTTDLTSRTDLLSTGVVATLVAELPIGIVLLSTDGSVVYANAAARPMWADAHASAAPSSLDAIVADALLAGVVVRDREITVDSCDGRRERGWRGRHHLLVNATPLCRALHQMEGVLVTLEDITERKELADVRPVIDSLVRL